MILKNRLHSWLVRCFLTVTLVLLCKRSKNGVYANFGGISVKWSKKWEMNRKNLIIIIIFTILSLVYCFLPLLISRCEATEMMPEQQKYISVPMQQWNALKKNTQMLDANLILLEQNLTAQEQRSAELMNLLTEARNALSETQKALLNANKSLANAEKSLQTATTLSEKLKRQIEQEREAARDAEKKAYRKGWLNGFCVGLVTTGIAVITK